MPLIWKYSTSDINWFELSELYQRAPLGDKKPNDLKTVFTNSLYKCFIFESDTLIAVGRALADGFDCSYICDVAVLPEYQSAGLGKKIVTKLVELSQAHSKIILYTVPGTESFYTKIGFKRMSTAMAIFKNQQLALEYGLVNDN